MVFPTENLIVCTGHNILFYGGGVNERRLLVTVTNGVMACDYLFSIKHRFRAGSHWGGTTSGATRQGDLKATSDATCKMTSV